MTLKLKLSLAGVLLAATFAGIALLSQKTPDPIVDHQPISIWLCLSLLEKYAPADKREQMREELQPAERAITKAGTNALPLLLQLISVRESPGWKRELAYTASKSRWWPSFFRINGRESDEARYQALWGFRILGAQAAPAVPVLSNRLMRARSEETLPICRALDFIGPAALPTFRYALTNPPIVRQQAVMRDLIGCKIISELRPEIAQLTNHSSSQVTYHAMACLLSAQTTHDEILFALRHPNRRIVTLGLQRVSRLQDLRKFEAEFVRLMNHPDEGVRSSVAALRTQSAYE